jgi:MAPEG family
MTLELKMLALSTVLGLVQIVLASHAASLQRGYVWMASSRDEAMPALTGVAGRLERALQNFVETFPLFAAAVLTGHVAATHDRVGCSTLFLGSHRLSRPVRGRGFSVAVPCMERGGARDRLGPSVSRKAMSRPSELRLAQVSVGVLLLVIIVPSVSISGFNTCLGTP